ncbi:MAG: M20 family peptidase, partial [Dehalococcoidales bacterium]|nr:M20 family peptidase [Dehalococcoidales bacterium]
MKAEELKTLVISQVDAHSSQLNGLSSMIHAHPETSFKETKAAAWLIQYLTENGFSIEKGAYGLPTAFRASYGQGQPAIAMLAEYDALPGIGHACGHNLIAACAVG